LLVLVSQRGQVLTVAEALPAVAAPVVVATLVVALAQRQLSPVAAFEQHRCSVVAEHTSLAEVSAR